MALDSASHLHVGGSGQLILPLENAIDSDGTLGFLIDLDLSGTLVNVSRFGGQYHVRNTSGDRYRSIG